MKKEEIIVGTKVWYCPILGDSKKEEAVITSGPYEMCGTVCCNIDIRSSVVCIDNLKNWQYNEQYENTRYREKSEDKKENKGSNVSSTINKALYRLNKEI